MNTMADSLPNLKVRWRYAVCLAGCLVSFGLSETVNADPIEDMLARWREREGVVRSLEVQMRRSMWYARGSVTPADMWPGVKETPAEDTEFTESAPVQLLLDGNKVRYEHELSSFEARRSAEVSARYASAFDGEDSVDISRGGDMHHPIAVVAAEPGYQDIGNLHLMPVFLWCRPIRFYGFREADFEVTRDRVLVDGHECVELRRKQVGGTQEQFLVDPDCGYVVRQYRHMVHGQVRARLDISYQAVDHMEVEYKPDAWRAAFLNVANGNPQEESNNNTIAFSLNPEIPSARFQIEFPPGTWVADKKRGEAYLVLTDGTRRPITRDELDRGTSYDELLATPPREVGSTQSRSRTWILVANVALVMIFGISLTVRAWIRKRGG